MPGSYQPRCLRWSSIRRRHWRDCCALCRRDRFNRPLACGFAPWKYRGTWMHRVLHINDYPAEAGGGAEVVMSRTMMLLRQAGVLVDTFTCNDLSDQRRTPWRYISNSEACNALTVKLQAFRPDVVHLHNFYHVLSPGA